MEHKTKRGYYYLVDSDGSGFELPYDSTNEEALFEARFPAGSAYPESWPGAISPIPSREDWSEILAACDQQHDEWEKSIVEAYGTVD